MAEFNLKAGIQSLLPGDLEGRSQHIGASEIGQCARRLWYEKHLGREHYDHDYQGPMGAAARGQLLEVHWAVPAVREALLSYGRGTLSWAGDYQLSLKYDEGKISATPDGLISQVPNDFLKSYGVESLDISHHTYNSVALEIKSIDPMIREESLPKPQHVAQLNQQLGLFRLIRASGKEISPEMAAVQKKLLMVSPPLWGIIYYTQASHLDVHYVFPHRFDEEAFLGQIRRAQQIYDAPKAEDLRPEGAVAGGAECKYCPFRGLCTGYAELVPTVSRNNLSQIKDDHKPLMRRAVAAVANSRRQIVPLTERKAEAEAQIKELLTANNLSYMEGELPDGRKFKINWNRTGGVRKGAWDETKLIETLLEHGEDPDEFKKESSIGERLTVKVEDLGFQKDGLAHKIRQKSEESKARKERVAKSKAKLKEESNV